MQSRTSRWLCISLRWVEFVELKIWISLRKWIVQQNHFFQLISGPIGFDSGNKISWHCHFKFKLKVPASPSLAVSKTSLGLKSPWTTGLRMLCKKLIPWQIKQRRLSKRVFTFSSSSRISKEHIVLMCLGFNRPGVLPELWSVWCTRGFIRKPNRGLINGCTRVCRKGKKYEEATSSHWVEPSTDATFPGINLSWMPPYVDATSCLCVHQAYRLISRDRPTKLCVFLKILTNFLFPFCFAALSFLPTGIGGVLWILLDLIRNTVNLYYSPRIWNTRNKSIKLLPKFVYLHKYYHPVSSYAHEPCRKLRKVYKRSTF